MNGAWLAVMVLGAVLSGAFVGVMAVLAAFAFARSLDEPDAIQYVLDEEAVEREFRGLTSDLDPDDIAEADE